MKVSIGCGWKYDGSTFDEPTWSDEQRAKENEWIESFDGYIGVDKGDYGQHHNRDLRRGLPFGNDSVDEIVADNILEHIDYSDHFGEADYIFIMNECLRVLKVGGVMKIVVPHYDTYSQAKDPTHVRSFTKDSFKYMAVGNAWDYGFKKGWEVLSSERSSNHSETMAAELKKVCNG